ncbi:MAG TPA: AarF/UbiB family protein, partial [Burkholderiaceae bacterium]|nr:AarF/UbiB family protein [Burkholderiaceae bacterium]
ERAGFDLKLLAQRGVDNVLKMILEDGFFQADPHPGNVIYLPGNRIAMIDFGMVGRLSLARRNQIIDLLAGITRRESEPMVDVLLDWAGGEAVDEERLAADVDDLVGDYADLPVKDMRVGELIGRITALMRTHGIVLPSDLTLMFKALITLEGSGRRYDPEFVLADRLKPFVERALAARYAPVEMGRRGGAGLGQFVDLMRAIPRDLARLLKDARRGRLRLDLDLKRLDSFVRKLDRTINRITIGIMTASVVIGSSIVMTVTSGPQVFGIPIFTVLGSLGYLLAFVNSVWVVLSIWRSRSD